MHTHLLITFSTLRCQARSRVLAAPLAIPSQEVLFDKSIIILTSNLGATQMQDLLDSKFGFLPKAAADLQKIDTQISTTAMKAVEKKFSPEFVNRVQHHVVFRALSQESIDQIFEIELRRIRARILARPGLSLVADQKTYAHARDGNVLSMALSSATLRPPCFLWPPFQPRVSVASLVAH